MVTLHSPRQGIRDPALPPWGSALLWNAIGPWVYAAAVGERAAVRARAVRRRTRRGGCVTGTPGSDGVVRLEALARELHAGHLDRAERAELSVVERERRCLLRSADTVTWTGGGRARVA